jgi:hypothetical protein
MRFIVDRPRLARAVGIGFVLVLVLMLAWNVRNVPDMQKQVFRVDRFKMRPRNIAAVADDSWKNMSHYMPSYHRLRILAGKTVRIDAREVKAHRFYLERLSRLHLELASEPLDLPEDTEERLAGQIVRSWWLGKPRLKLVIDPAAPRYVLAHGGPEGKVLFLLPEPLFQSLRTQAAAAAPPAPTDETVPDAPEEVRP